MSKDWISKEILKEVFLPALFGMICLMIWLSEREDVLIFIFSAIIFKTYLESFKKKEIKVSNRKSALDRSEMRKIARMIDKVSNKNH